MTNETKQTAVDIIYQGMCDKIVMQDLNKALICIHISHNDLIKLHQQAKEMEKERIIKAYDEDLYGGLSGNKKFKDGKEYYEFTYGGKK